MLVYVITAITALALTLIYFSKWSAKNKLALFFILWLETIAIMTIFVSPYDILGGKFPLPPILFIFLILSFFVYNILHSPKNIYSKEPPVSANYLRTVGILLVTTSILLEIFVFDGNFSANSVSLIIFGMYLFSYPNLKLQYNYKKMLLVFLGLYSLIYPLGTIVFRIISNHFTFLSDEEWTDFVVNLVLGRPVTSFLTFLNYQVWSSGSTIFYIDTTVGHSASVSIATGCSGIDSVIIFICALFSYIYVEYRILDPITLLLFFLGIFMSYFANIMRMSVIILAGHYWGADALQFAHATVGWLIFTFWVFIFWRIMDFILIGNIMDNLRSTR